VTLVRKVCGFWYGTLFAESKLTTKRAYPLWIRPLCLGAPRESKPQLPHYITIYITLLPSLVNISARITSIYGCRATIYCPLQRRPPVQPSAGKRCKRRPGRRSTAGRRETQDPGTPAMDWHHRRALTPLRQPVQGRPAALAHIGGSGLWPPHQTTG